jgi:phosphatidylserine/phosphatidylglycerophosphate/cardiolipin synthase-like enzyme
MQQMTMVRETTQPREPSESDAPAAGPRLLAPGRNCWRIAPSSRAAILPDACHYFPRLDEALRKAERSITIIGWDFDGRIKLKPDCGDDCPQLGDLLRSLVEDRPELEIRILVWSVAVIHAAGAPIPLLLGAPWQDHPRITLKLDQEHPFYGSHHQKLVIVDDQVAFIGGMDLTVQRWDSCGHADSDPIRLDPDGCAYSPLHDVHSIIEGEAARALGDVARDRWRRATGEILQPVAGAGSLWPEDLEPDFVDVDVGIARTAPAFGKEPAIGELEELTLDMLAAARHSVYIEAQYFSARSLRKVLTKSLLATHGPEIIVVTPRPMHGWLERMVMAQNRDRLLRHLRRADRHNRLRVFYPVVPAREGKACQVMVHSKLVIIDDEILRIGSANLNNRSMGLDTECDIVIEANNDATRRAIAHVRHRLLGEHLDVSPEAVAQAVIDRGSLVHAIDYLNRNRRGLRPFPETKLNGPIESVLCTWLFDPTRPLQPLWWRRRHKRKEGPRRLPRRVRKRRVGAAPAP